MHAIPSLIKIVFPRNVLAISCSLLLRGKKNSMHVTRKSFSDNLGLFHTTIHV